jgi:homocysteine S-methyltransferase
MSTDQFLLDLAAHPLLLDGALATELQRAGCNFDIAPLWSASTLISDPEKIYDVHLSYFRAGADVAITSSYQASIQGLQEHAGFSEDDSVAVIQRSVDLAKRARSDYLRERQAEAVEGRRLYVAGSVGPYGAYLNDCSEYSGDYHLAGSLEEFMAWHRLRIKTLVESGVDVLALETIPSRTEALALVELLERHFPNTPAWISFTLKDASHISDGTSLAELAASICKSSSVCAIGVNCISSVLVDDALRNLSDPKIRNNKPLVAYPNSGEKWNAAEKQWYGGPENRARLKEYVKRWERLGARLIGGCCRTNPEDIREMHNVLINVSE